MNSEERVVSINVQAWLENLQSIPGPIGGEKSTT